MNQSFADQLHDLDQLVAEENRQGVQDWFLAREFTVIVLSSEDDDEDAFPALIVEGEDFSSIVAFLDPERAEEFAQSIAEQVEDSDVQLLEIDGPSLLEPMNGEIGVVFNPELDDMLVVPASLLVSDDTDSSDSDS
jgi:hypothetical protein